MVQVRLRTMLALALLACQPMLLSASSPVRTDVYGGPLPPEAMEFFKLAHEIGKPDLADSARSAAKQVRR